MKATLTHRDYWHLTEDQRDELARWFEAETGLVLATAMVSTITLGEGVIECLRYVTEEGRFMVCGSEVVTFISTHPVRSLPPVWVS